MLPAASAVLILTLAHPAASSKLAHQLRAVGYSTSEVTDIITGRVSRKTIDKAHAMKLVGRGREADALLASEYRKAAAPAMPSLVTLAPMPVPVDPVVESAPVARPPITSVEARPSALSKPQVVTPKPQVVARALPPARTQPKPPLGSTTTSVEAAINKYSRLHAVDATLVRAIIAAESGFGAGARSSAGAIGLMQLMPATARTLGVNPRVPDENIEGGVRYLAQLLKAFGQVELALVAYNAGPAFAERYSRGEAALYDETREYVKQVLGRIRTLR